MQSILVTPVQIAFCSVQWEQVESPGWTRSAWRTRLEERSLWRWNGTSRCWSSRSIWLRRGRLMNSSLGRLCLLNLAPLRGRTPSCRSSRQQHDSMTPVRRQRVSESSCSYSHKPSERCRELRSRHTLWWRSFAGRSCLQGVASRTCSTSLWRKKRQWSQLSSRVRITSSASGANCRACLDYRSLSSKKRFECHRRRCSLQCICPPSRQMRDLLQRRHMSILGIELGSRVSWARSWHLGCHPRRLWEWGSGMARQLYS